MFSTMRPLPLQPEGGRSLPIFGGGWGEVTSSSCSHTWAWLLFGSLPDASRVSSSSFLVLHPYNCESALCHVSLLHVCCFDLHGNAMLQFFFAHEAWIAFFSNISVIVFCFVGVIFTFTLHFVQYHGWLCCTPTFWLAFFKILIANVW